MARTPWRASSSSSLRAAAPVRCASRAASRPATPTCATASAVPRALQGPREAGQPAARGPRSSTAWARIASASSTSGAAATLASARPLRWPLQGASPMAAATTTPTPPAGRSTAAASCATRITRTSRSALGSTSARPDSRATASSSASRGASRTARAPPCRPVVPESVESTTYTRLRAAWQVPLARRAHTQLDAGLSGEGEWGRNTSVLKLPDFMGGDVPGDYSKDRATVGAFGAVRHQRGAPPLRGRAAPRRGERRLAAGQPARRCRVPPRPRRDPAARSPAGAPPKQPSFFALASPPALGGNPDLEPEHVWGGEAGVEHRVTAARLDLGATCFLQQFNNLVDFDFEQFLHVNRARVRTQGFELTARWQPHRTLSIEGEATYLEVEDLAGGTLLHTPRWTGGGRMTWQPLPQLNLRVHGSRQLALPRRAVPGARPRHRRRLRPARGGRFLALRQRARAARPRRQPDGPQLRDADRLPRPGPLVLGRHRLGAAVGAARPFATRTMARGTRRRRRREPAYAVDPTRLEFLRSGIGLLLDTADGPVQVTYVSRGPDDRQALWDCTCRGGRRGRACDHVAVLQAQVDACHELWGGRSWQSRFEPTIWHRLARCCFGECRAGSAEARAVAVTASGRPSTASKRAHDGELIALAATRRARGAAARPLRPRPARQRRGQPLAAAGAAAAAAVTDLERALNERGSHTERQAFEQSVLYRLAYHAFRESAGDAGVFHPLVDTDTADFVLSHRRREVETLRFVVPKPLVESVLGLLHEHQPERQDLLIHPIPLRSLFRVTAATEIDVDVRPLIEVLQKNGESRFFDRARRRALPLRPARLPARDGGDGGARGARARAQVRGAAAHDAEAEPGAGLRAADGVAGRPGGRRRVARAARLPRARRGGGRGARARGRRLLAEPALRLRQRARAAVRAAAGQGAQAHLPGDRQRLDRPAGAGPAAAVDARRAHGQPRLQRDDALRLSSREVLRLGGRGQLRQRAAAGRRGRGARDGCSRCSRGGPARPRAGCAASCASTRRTATTGCCSCTRTRSRACSATTWASARRTR